MLSIYGILFIRSRSLEPEMVLSKLAIVGAGGHGKVVADAAARMDGWSSIVFYDDERVGRRVAEQWEVVGSIEELEKQPGAYAACIVALGDNKRRLEISKKLIVLGFELATIIHPSASISSFSTIGNGSAILANAVVNIDAQVGLACIINTSSVVEHDCVLADGVHICPGSALAGNVAIGSLSTIGLKSCVRQNLIIGHEVHVGAGATVVNDIEASQIVVGTPAKAKSTS